MLQVHLDAASRLMSKGIIHELMISDAERVVMHTFTAFQNTIRQITEDDTIITVEQITTTLLTSKTFQCAYMGNVIRAVDIYLDICDKSWMRTCVYYTG